MTIRFYSTKDAYGCFSNFSAHPFEIDGKRWPTSEHYFQAQKFAGSDYEETIRNAASPMIAARLGRSRKHPLRSDWESAKDDIMRRAVMAKFSAHTDIRDILLGTNDDEIVETTSKDYYWGCGTDGTGRNMLGKILMEVREALKGER